MKKLLILLSLFSLPLFSQTEYDGKFNILLYKGSRYITPTPQTYSDEAQALFDRMPNSATNTEKQNIDVAIKSLVANSIWPKLRSFAIPALLVDSANAQLNWITNDRNLTAQLSVDWTSQRGFTGHAADASYMEMDFNPSTDGGGLYTHLGASIGAYVNTNPTEDHTFVFGNSGGGTPTVEATGVIYRTGSWQGKINEGTAGYTEFFNTGRKMGLMTQVRTDTTTERIYFNGVFQNQETGLTTGNSLLNQQFQMFRNANTALNRSDTRVAAWFYGGILTDSDVSNIYAAIQTALTSVGASETWSNDTMLIQGFEGTGYDNYSKAWTKSGNSYEDYTTRPIAGSQSDSIASNAYISTDIPIYSDTVSMTWRMRCYDITPAANQDILYLRNLNTPGTSETSQLFLRLYTTGRIYMQHGTPSNYGTTVLSDNVNYYCWLDFIGGSGSNGQSRFYISATSTKPLTPECVITTGTSTLDINKIRVIGAPSVIDNINIFVP